MIIVDAMPDEPAAGHEARRMTILGCDSQSEHLRLMRADLAREGESVQDVPRLHLLARTARIAVEDYVQHHSMLALLRVAARTRDVLSHGSPEAATFSRRLGMALHRAGVYVCNDCIDSDLARTGFSWYRRAHHVAGIDWCPAHGGPLCEVIAARPFQATPHSWRDQGLIAQLSPHSHRIPEHGLVQRYIDVSLALIKRDRPIDEPSLRNVLSRRAQFLGLEVNPDESGPRVSDRLLSLVDPAWVRRMIASAGEKRRGVYFSPIDYVVKAAGDAGASVGYLLAFATLYDSAEAALDAVSETTKHDHPMRSNPAAHGTGSKSRHRAPSQITRAVR